MRKPVTLEEVGRLAVNLADARAEERGVPSCRYEDDVITCSRGIEDGILEDDEETCDHCKKRLALRTQRRAVSRLLSRATSSYRRRRDADDDADRAEAQATGGTGR